MRPLRSISLQSKLLATVLFLVLSAIALVAWIGYASARDSLRASALSQVQSMQRAKAGAVAAALEGVRNEVLAVSAMPQVAAAAVELIAAYRGLDGTTLTAADRAAVEGFYAKEFTPAVDARLGVNSPEGAFLPKRNAGLYLHHRYIVTGPRPYTGGAELVSAADDSAYGRALARLRPELGETIRRLGFDNILLTDPETLEVFFSFKASTALGTSLADGPYASSHLAEAVRALRRSQDIDDYKLSDFEFYRPALGAPRAFERRMLASSLPTESVWPRTSAAEFGRALR